MLAEIAYKTAPNRVRWQPAPFVQTVTRDPDSAMLWCDPATTPPAVRNATTPLLWRLDGREYESVRIDQEPATETTKGCVRVRVRLVEGTET